MSAAGIDTDQTFDGPVVDVEDLHRHYFLPREHLFRPPDKVRALNGVSFQLAKGRSLGIVGESGCGKSTLARLIMALDRPTMGAVRILGRDVAALPADELLAMRRHFQIVFQDPYGALNPRHKVARIIGEPLAALERGVSAADRRARIVEVAAAVGLREGDLGRFPHEFSGGQRQRIAIARALTTRPALIVADEPVSALDVSVQAQVLNMMKDLQTAFGLTYILISHDLSVVNYVCDRVAVMYRGRFVELGARQALFENPRHPYTKTLLAAVPTVGLGRRRRRHERFTFNEGDLATPLREVAPDHYVIGDY